MGMFVAVGSGTARGLGKPETFGDESGGLGPVQHGLRFESVFESGIGNELGKLLEEKRKRLLKEFEACAHRGAQSMNGIGEAWKIIFPQSQPITWEEGAKARHRQLPRQQCVEGFLLSIYTYALLIW